MACYVTETMRQIAIAHCTVVQSLGSRVRDKPTMGTVCLSRYQLKMQGCRARWSVEFWELSGVRVSWLITPRRIMSNTKRRLVILATGYSFCKLHPEISRSYKHAAKSLI